MLIFKKPRVALSAVAMAMVAMPALADTDTDTLTVQVTVQEACTISGTTLDFGTYTGGQQAALDGQGALSYSNCASGTLTIALDGGTSGSVNNRAMSDGGSGNIAYQLYRNSARSQVWGEGAEAQQIVLLEPGAGSVPVYGRIPGGQNVAAGNYVDTVNVTLSF